MTEAYRHMRKSSYPVWIIRTLQVFVSLLVLDVAFAIFMIGIGLISGVGLPPAAVWTAPTLVLFFIGLITGSIIAAGKIVVWLGGKSR